MCVDYTDLNKHCPKDPFGLPRIDQVIDSTAVTTFSASSTATPGTTRSQSRKKTVRRPRSSPRLARTATRPCPSG
jgi:hypothetical protein